MAANTRVYLVTPNRPDCEQAPVQRRRVPGRDAGRNVTCTPVTLPGGARAIVCTRGQRPRCACGQRATLQCDAPTQRKSGTCDRHLCAACATEVGPDRHLCPAHAHERQQRRQRERQDHEPTPMEPWRAELF